MSEDVPQTGIEHMIVLEDASVRRGKCRLLVHDLRVGRGLTLIEGTNGSGKTTLLDVMAGQLRVRSASSAHVLNHKLTRRWALPTEFYTNVSYVRQSQALPRRWLVRDVLEYAEWLRPAPDPVPRHALAVERLGLQGLRERKVGSLSGGETQRLLIAVGVLRPAPVLLVDEPLNNLDDAGRVTILDLLRERSASAAVLVAGHGYHIDGSYKVTVSDGQVHSCA